MTAPTSETRRLFANFAWENSPLGSVSAWPPEMQAVVRTVLGSAFPICTFWGEESVLIYNDAFVGLFAAPLRQSFGIPLRDGWGDIRNMLAPAIDRVRFTGETLSFHRTMLPLARIRQPEECYFDLSYSAVRNLDDEIIGVMLVAVGDLSSQVVREQRREERARLQTMVKLTGGVAHDFNNFLTVVLGSLDILGATLPKSSVQWQAVENARLASERAASLTNQLLSYSVPQPLQARATDIHELIAEVGSLIKSTLGESNRLVFEFGENLPPCVLDRTQITSAILNLATNARDAMTGGGRLTIRTRLMQMDEPVCYDTDHVLAPGTYVSVRFEDTGEGIPEELRSRIFEPFFTTKQTGSGTGLGLSMVRRCIRQTGGEARALRAPGEGACIELLIPSSHHLDSTDRSHTPLMAEGFRGKPIAVVIENQAESKMAATAVEPNP